MIALKKMYRDELLQFALLLSLLRVNQDAYLETDLYSTISDLDFGNGTSWRSFATGVLRPHYVHPKSLDYVLLNYERELFADLHSLGRYSPRHAYNQTRNITAYLLSVDRNTVLNVNCESDSTDQQGTEQPLSQNSNAIETLTPNDNAAAAVTLLDVDLGLSQEVSDFNKSIYNSIYFTFLLYEKLQNFSV